jgi:uncharacterized coiled-coil protein SlyX
LAHYELDRLGWHNFEWLIQALLKSEFGFLVESWGAYKDQGRDAYSGKNLESSTGKGKYSGPVIFQAKFVSQANAVGSDYRKHLLAAVRHEAQAIEERINAKIWVEPQTYVLLTNCPITTTERAEIIAILKEKTTAAVYIQSGNDIGELLDLHPEIARIFPQILSYRNLLILLATALNKGVLERSSAALAGAQEIIPVFVPTGAYEEAWKILRKHNFVVLTGPPEMGKTSIGWMIAMAQMANGWQVIECKTPDNVFELYDSSAKQVFLADDAFGRTEFKVERGAQWEEDLAKVLQRVDADHWLIWTSRKHILERALREMDLQGKAAGYPSPAEVLVQADKLTLREKALILYRHASNELLDDAARKIIKGNLSVLVSDAHFTPERIRRFVKQVLPRLANEQKTGILKPGEVALEVEKAIEKYTEMMEKSFSKLSEEQQWILVSLLDEENVKGIDELEEAFTRLSPFQTSKPMQELLSELDESFIRVPKHDISKEPWRRLLPRKLDWIHPSYRDLLIEKLSINRKMRVRYLTLGGIAAIGLALSQVGGASGEREFPLLPDDESWQALTGACQEVISHGKTSSIDELLAILDSIATSPSPYEAKIDQLAELVCNTVSKKWNEVGEDLTADKLSRFYKISVKAPGLIASPDLSQSWSSHFDLAEASVKSRNTQGLQLDADDIADWAEMMLTLQQNEPRFLKKVGFPSKYSSIVDEIITIASEEAVGDVSFDDPDDYYAEAERLRKLETALANFKDLFSEKASQIAETEKIVHAQADHMEEEHERHKDREPEDFEPQSESAPKEIFSISDLFIDL